MAWSSSSMAWPILLLAGVIARQSPALPGGPGLRCTAGGRHRSAWGDRLVVFDQVQAGLGGPGGVRSSALRVPGGGPRVRCTRGTAGAGVAVAAEQHLVSGTSRRLLVLPWPGWAMPPGPAGQRRASTVRCRAVDLAVPGTSCPARPRSCPGQSWVSPLSALSCRRRGEHGGLSRSPARSPGPGACQAEGRQATRGRSGRCRRGCGEGEVGRLDVALAGGSRRST